jgi:hypothetical protein
MKIFEHIEEGFCNAKSHSCIAEHLSHKSEVHSWKMTVMVLNLIQETTTLNMSRRLLGIITFRSTKSGSIFTLPPDQQGPILQDTKGIVPPTTKGSNSGAEWREFKCVGGAQGQM